MSCHSPTGDFISSLTWGKDLMVVEAFQHFAIFISRGMSFGQCKKDFLKVFHSRAIDPEENGVLRDFHSRE